jgi:hypothetical protein
MPLGKSNVIVVMACPICGFILRITTLKLHLVGVHIMFFCLDMHKQTKSNVYTKPTCGKVFSNHWITSLRFKQFIISMRRTKVEKGCSKRFILNATKNFQGSTLASSWKIYGLFTLPNFPFQLAYS